MSYSLANYHWGRKHYITRQATPLILSAGLGVQRWSRGRQPVVQTPNPVVQDLLCGKLQKKCRTTGKNPWHTGEKSGQNTGNDFLALGSRVVLYLPITCNGPAGLDAHS